MFEQLDAKNAGVNFENRLTYTEEFNTYLFRSFYNGAGIGLADLNNDGFLDLFFCGNQTDNALYLGDGNFNFKDITNIAGVASPNAWSTGVSIVDINQDGWLDVYICKSGDPKDANRRNELFINKGTNAEGIPIFEESAVAYGIDDLGFSVHAVFFDYDKDGDVDMYLSNNSINPSEIVIDVKRGIRDKQDGGGGDKLYRNDGDHFTNVSKEAGIYSSVIGFGLGISVADVNRDSWPDIYVANDFFEKDYLYMNNGDGTFTESITQMAQELSLGSMGVDIADMNHDGFPEIFVTEMLPKTESRLKTKAVFDGWDQYQLKVKNGYHHQFPRNAFQMNNGRSTGNSILFSEISRYSGVSATDWSWGVQMADFDLDGSNEIFITNGIPKDLLDQDYIDYYSDPNKVRNILQRDGAVIKTLIDDIPSKALANYMFKEADDLKFEDTATAWGLGAPSFSSGSAYGDIDNDGDLDLVVNNIDDSPFIYKNNSDHAKNHFMAVNVKNKNGASALGAQVTLTVNGEKQYKELYPMRGVMSVVDIRLNFGLGGAQVVDTLEIIWPSGKKLVKTDIAANQFLSYSETEAKGDQIKDKSSTARTMLSIANDIEVLRYPHTESEYDDFKNEKLLYQMISNEGPNIAVGDVNGDTKADFFMPSAKGFASVLYLQGENGFSVSNTALFEKDALSEDTHALFFDANGDADLDILVATGGPEVSLSSFTAMDRLYLNDGKGNFTKSKQLLPNGRPSSTSVIVNADFDGDGDQDLFFGGRSVPGAYGVPSSSHVLENDGKGNFTNITKNRAVGLLEMGMVTDAVWMDFDTDGDQDLIIAGEWMPIRVFENIDGNFTETTKNVGLSHTNGFWNTIEKADVDCDGKEDIIAGNMGENTFFKATHDRPVKMFVNDFDQNGRAEQILTTYQGTKDYPMAQKKELTAQLPSLAKKYLKYTDYKEQQVTDIFSSEQLQNALTYKVFSNSSMIFWNDGGTFTSQKLPFAAQLTPIYGIFAGDLNDDGTMELVLGGNQHRAKPQTGIYSGSYGTVLTVSKNRKIQTVKPSDSGVHILGEIRDIKKINIKDKEYLLFARNNDSLISYAIEN